MHPFAFRRALPTVAFFDLRSVTKEVAKVGVVCRASCLILVIFENAFRFFTAINLFSFLRNKKPGMELLFGY
jgi:hypothetical protein